MKKCHKVRFDLIGAKLALAKIAKSTNWKRAEQRAYWCRICRAFHLTSKPKRFKLEHVHEPETIRPDEGSNQSMVHTTVP